MMIVLIGLAVVGGLVLLVRVKQACLWCGKKERLYGALLCSFCTTCARVGHR